MNVANILTTLAVMGLKTLRENIVLARVVNHQYEGEITAQRKNATVNVVVPSAVAVADVTAAATYPATTAVTPTVIPVTLSQHKEAAFDVTDFDLQRVDQGIIPMQASEAVKALANTIDAYLFSLCKFYGWGGASGTTPFATDLTAFLDARKAAANQLMPMDNRFAIINPDAEANALGLRAFQDASFRGDTAGIVSGQIGTKLGALWAMSQNVPLHTTGAATAGTIALDDSVARAVGLKVLHMDGFSVKPSAGDVFTIAGDTQTYVVTSATTLAGTDSDVSFEPGLKVAIPAVDGNEVVTFKSSFRKNLLFHRDALAFAMAPMEDSNIGQGMVAMQSIVDPVSGLSLRLELTRQYKQWRMSFDAIYGGALVRPEFGAIIAG